MFGKIHRRMKRQYMLPWSFLLLDFVPHEVSKDLIELEKSNEKTYINLIDESANYAYIVKINEDFSIKFDASYLNLRPGSKLRLLGGFEKDYFILREDSIICQINRIKFNTQVTALESNFILSIEPNILNIRAFSDINKPDSKLDTSGFDIIHENESKEDDKEEPEQDTLLMEELFQPIKEPVEEQEVAVENGKFPTKKLLYIAAAVVVFIVIIA